MELRDERCWNRIGMKSEGRVLDQAQARPSLMNTGLPSVITMSPEKWSSTCSSYKNSISIT